MATYPSSPAVFYQPTASSGYHFAYVSKTDGTHSYPYYATYELFDSSGNYHDLTSGFVIRWNSTTSKNEINVQDSGHDNNSNDPTHYKVDSGSIVDGSVWSEIQSGSTVTLYKNATGTTWGDPLVIGSSHLWSASGPIGTLSGGSSPEIKDVVFIKVTDSIVYLSFNWQNLNTAYLFVDSGGTVTQTNIALGGLGNSGTIAGSGYLTGLSDGDRCWIANTPDVYVHKVIEWSYDNSTKKVIAKAFFQDNGGNGFSQNADVALVRLLGKTYNQGQSLVEAQADPASAFANHDGTLKTLTLDASSGSRWAISNIDTSQYGTSFKVPSKSSFRNFW